VATTDDPRHELGRAGERVAEQYLRKQGLKTLARHFNTPVGELDLVMRDGDTIVFVEVKTRRDRKHAEPEDAVHGAKQRRLLRAAQWFIHARRWDDPPCRFDVIGVIMPAGASPDIKHSPDAFHPRRR